MSVERAVVDASAAAALLFNESRADEIAARMSGPALVAPTLLEYELAATCQKKILQHPDQESALLRALEGFPALGVTLHDPDPGRLVALATDTGISAYDAAYLDLALGLGAELITLDARLDAAWQSRSD